MTKKIIRIVLCLFSSGAFFLTALTAILNFSVEPTVKAAVSAGLGLSNVSPTDQNYNTNLKIPAFHSVDFPRDPYVPLAMRLYDSLPPETQTEGQDPPPEETEPSLPADVFPVIPLDLSENQAEKGIIYINESKYTPDLKQVLTSEFPINYTKTVSTSSVFEPIVLIVHTHGTECYLPNGDTTYTLDTPTRSKDTETNVVAVGKVLSDTLNSQGIPTLHCEIMFDAESYSDSYDLSEKAVTEYLAKYPSIRYVFDVHRDSVVRENNEKIKPFTTINGIPTAQAMFVVGTDSSGANHPNWMDNLTVAAHFQQSVLINYGNIIRPLNLRAASFNAEHAPGSILIEIGTCGNTVEEAKNCARFLGNSIAPVILNDGL